MQEFSSWEDSASVGTTRKAVHGDISSWCVHVTSQPGEFSELEGTSQSYSLVAFYTWLVGCT